MDPQGAGLVFRKYARVPVPRDHSAAFSWIWVFGLQAHAVFFFFEKVECGEKNALCKEKKRHRLNEFEGFSAVHNVPFLDERLSGCVLERCGRQVGEE